MKRTGYGFLFVLAVVALAPTRALAQCPPNPVCITPGPDADAFAAGIGMSTDQLVAQLVNQVNGLFQTSNINGFLRDFQNAQSFSTKGLGVDYASEATLAEIG